MISGIRKYCIIVICFFPGIEEISLYNLGMGSMNQLVVKMIKRTVSEHKTATLGIALVAVILATLISVAAVNSVFTESIETPMVRYGIAEQHAFPEATAPRTVYVTLPTPPPTGDAAEARTTTLTIMVASTAMMGVLVGAMLSICIRSRKGQFTSTTLKMDNMVARIAAAAFFGLVAAYALMFVFTEDASAATYYVDETATGGADDGSSWTNAYTDRVWNKKLATVRWY